jgi:hypothetical protein
MDAADAVILIAEDNPTIRDVVSDLLEAEAYTVVLARDGIEALGLHGAILLIPAYTTNGPPRPGTGLLRA